MNYTRTNPLGIDKAIQKIQDKLYNKLGFNNIDGYGRVYPLEKDGNIIPTHYITGTDYKEVLFNDKGDSNGNFFFYENPISKKVNSEQTETTIHIVFQLDVNEIFQSTNNREDEKIRVEIERVLRHTSFSVDEITRGVKALEDFNHNLRDRKLLFLRFTGKIRYQLNC